MVGEDLAAVPDAAKHTETPETTIRTAMEKGGIPYRIIFGRKVVRLTDVEEHLRTSQRGRPKK